MYATSLPVYKVDYENNPHNNYNHQHYHHNDNTNDYSNVTGSRSREARLYNSRGWETEREIHILYL